MGGRPGETASRDAVSSRVLADDLGIGEATVRRARQAELAKRGLIATEERDGNTTRP